MNKLRVAILVNPVAGVGGSVALKGSDGVSKKALSLGAVPKASQRMTQMLSALTDKSEYLELMAWHGDMGVKACREAGLSCKELGKQSEQTSSLDTRLAVEEFQKLGVDLILFAGGDGTARDISQVADETQLFLGVPAGVKIHSGVYAVSPIAAAEIVKGLIAGNLVEVIEGDVRDIDEEAFRHDRLVSKFYAVLKVPRLGGFLQQVKTGGREDESLAIQDIAAGIAENLEDDVYYLMGTGSTVAAVMEELGLDNTLLGVDIVKNRELVATDVSRQNILELTANGSVKIIVTLIGGQGHIFGRGNQQLSSQVIRSAGLKNIIVVATKSKIKSLEGRPLIVDTDDAELNRELCGFIEVVTGYDDVIVYPVSDGAGVMERAIEN